MAVYNKLTIISDEWMGGTRLASRTLDLFSCNPVTSVTACVCPPWTNARGIPTKEALVMCGRLHRTKKKKKKDYVYTALHDRQVATGSFDGSYTRTSRERKEIMQTRFTCY